ncbi:MAG TPA: CusA/CzcA family heavy metal efflux RND transporter [Labilithrix sp.]|nr:CusA/CzcA family heavy metal efflux RND transporter [Labilithrix sp.]
MIDGLIAWSIKNRVVVFVLTVVFVMLGGVAAAQVPIDAVPDVTNVQVQVITQAPALGPVDVETYVTAPVERAMAGIPGLEEVRSISRAGISVVTLGFADSAELYLARQLVGERVTDARRNIPERYGSPQLGPVSSGLGEVFHFEVKSTKGDKSLMDLRTVLDWQIGPRLKLVPGVVEVNAFGGEARSLELALDPRKMAAAGVGVAEVAAAIERNHVASGGAYFTDGRETVTVRAEGRIASAKDLGEVVVERKSARTPLYLKDLGEIHEAPIVRYGAVTRDGRKDEAVVGVVMMLRGANSRKVVNDVKEAVADIQKSLPPGVVIDAYYDRTDLVGRTVKTVSTNLVEASLLVLVVLFLTLVNLRAGAVVAMAIPLALVGAFIGMWAFGVSGNLISLGAIDFGLVVDGAIIIVENALRRMAERREELGRPLVDAERRDIVFSASSEVRSATAFGEVIIALVYVPILALQSVEGRMFRPMAMTVLFALATAFVLSLTLVPAVASAILPLAAKDHPSRLVELARKAYTPSLRFGLRWPKVIALATLLAFAGSIVGAAEMGREFLPKLDEGTLVLAMVRLPSVSLDQSTEQARQVEKTLRELPEVTSVVSRTGRAEIAVDPMGMNMSDVYVLLKPKSEWTTVKTREELVEKLDKALAESVPGAGFAFSQPIEMNTNDLLAGISSDLALHLYGNDLAELRQTADHIVHTLRAIPGAKDVRAEQIAGMNTLTVTVDRQAIARAGVDAKAVTDTVGAIGGLDVGEIVDGAIRYPVRVRLSEDARRDQKAISAVPVRDELGNLVPLGQLATIAMAPGPSQISRSRLQRRITVELNVRGRDIGSFVEEAKVALDRDVKLPVGYYTVWAGEYERLQSAAKQLAIVIPIALALILVLLVMTFGRMRPALLIFVNVPMAISGGVAALAARGLPLSVSAGIGFIALFGVAVLNGLVLVTSIERLREGGATVADAVLRGANERLRPVLTTALVASLGFLPMALASGAGAEVQRPLATVVIGGLLSSTLLTLLVIPAVYAWLLRKESRPTPAAADAVASSAE